LGGQKIFVAIFGISLGIVRRFMPAALDGAGGKLRGAVCQIWSANLCLLELTTLSLKPMAEATCDDFNKIHIDTGRMYQPSFAVYITLGFFMLRHLLVFFVVTFMPAIGVKAAEPISSKMETIKAAAIEIRSIQKQQGNLIALSHIDECYAKVMRPSISYSKEVDACLTKDFVVATISAAFYSQLSPEGRKANNLDAKRTLDEMRRRLGGTFIFFGVPGEEAAAFGKLLVENALQAIQAIE
jgi:hypothetical protein